MMLTADDDESRKKHDDMMIIRYDFLFLSLRSFLAAEGPLTQGCCTGQPPGTNCFSTGQSPDVLVVGKV